VGLAAVDSPWSRSKTARLLKVIAVSGWSGPSTRSRMARARRYHGLVPADVSDPGATTVPAKLLAGVVGELNEDSATVTLKEDRGR
jgi:hypothetical protein